MDASNRAQIKSAQRDAKNWEREKTNIIRAMMAQPSIRRYLHTILESCAVFGQTFNTNNSMMSFNEGRRSVGLQLFTDIITNAPQSYLQMMDEANARSSASDARKQSSAGRDDNAPDEPEPDTDSGQDWSNFVDYSIPVERANGEGTGGQA